MRGPESPLGRWPPANTLDESGPLLQGAEGDRGSQGGGGIDSQATQGERKLSTKAF